MPTYFRVAQQFHHSGIIPLLCSDRASQRLFTAHPLTPLTASGKKVSWYFFIILFMFQNKNCALCRTYLTHWRRTFRKYLWETLKHETNTAMHILVKRKKKNFLGWFLQLKFSQIKTDCMYSHHYLSIHIYPNVIRTFSFSILFKEIMLIIYFTLLLCSNEIIVHSGRLCL